MTLPETPADGPGFEVPGGDPQAISNAAFAHSEYADMMEMHAAVVHGLAGRLDSGWQGQADDSWELFTAQFGEYINSARDGLAVAGKTLSEWSFELGEIQRKSQHALTECEAAIKQQQHWYFQWQDAEKELKTAAQQLGTAQTPSSGPPPSSPFSPVLAPPGSTPPAVSPAVGKLLVADAEQKVQAMYKKFQEATKEVTHWQKVGQQAWDQAADLAQDAGDNLTNIHVESPPLAGYARAEPSLASSLQQFVNAAGDVVASISAITGTVAVLTFWIPGVGEVTTSVAVAAAGGVVLLDGVKVAVGDKVSLSQVAIDTIVAAIGGGAGGALKALPGGADVIDGVAGGDIIANTYVGVPLATFGDATTVKSVSGDLKGKQSDADRDG
jgi:hypothetical protein